MRLTLFIDSLRGGGAQRQLTEMARLFHKYGHDVSLVTYNDLPDDYQVVNGVKRIRLADGKSRLGRWWAILRYFNQDNFDAIISFLPGVSRFMLYAIMPRFINRKFKVLVGERSLISCPNSLTVKLMHGAYKYADYIVPNSDAQRVQLCNIRPEWANKIKTIINYTDLNSYTVSPLPNNSALRIAVFARYAPEKNCIRFARAVKLLKERTSSSFQIDWYGHISATGTNTPEEVYITTKEYVENNGLNDVLHLNDRVKDIREVMPLYDAVALPSLVEGFANAIAEGICCGRPILASDISDNYKMVQNKINGLLFDPTDEQSICDAFNEFLNYSAEQRTKMGEASRLLAEQLFNEQTFVDNYINLMK